MAYDQNLYGDYKKISLVSSEAEVYNRLKETYELYCQIGEMCIRDRNEYRKRGIVIFAAAIGDDKENIRRIYQDGFLDITKLEDLPKNMTQLVKQYLK